MSSLVAASELAIIVSGVQATKYFTVISIAILVWDYCITISSEIEFVWRAKWGPSKILFLLNRYLPFTDTALLALGRNCLFTESIRNANIISQPAWCKATIPAYVWLSKCGLYVTNIILFMRTWAVWGRLPVMTTSLVVGFIVIVVIDVYFTDRYIEDMTVLANSPTSGCAFLFHNRLIYVHFVLLLVSETLTVVLLSIKTMWHFRPLAPRTALMATMFNDGVIYYALIATSSVVNIILPLTLPPESQCLFSGFVRLIPAAALFSCRTTTFGSFLGVSAYFTACFATGPSCTSVRRVYTMTPATSL